MGRELRIRVPEDRTPPQFDDLEGFEITDDGEWRLSLDAHRELLVDLTGIEPEDELTLRDLVTIRARLEGYVERASRPAERAAQRSADEDRERNGTWERSPGWLRRLLGWLRAAVSRDLRGTTERADESTDRRSADEVPYQPETVRRLAIVFRAAADARRREVAPNAASPGRTAAD